MQIISSSTIIFFSSFLFLHQENFVRLFFIIFATLPSDLLMLLRRLLSLSLSLPAISFGLLGFEWKYEKASGA
jgi:hypothetical protein